MVAEAGAQHKDLPCTRGSTTNHRPQQELSKVEMHERAPPGSSPPPRAPQWGAGTSVRQRMEGQGCGALTLP